MSSVVRWNSQEGWQDWINESTSGRLPRLIGSALKLPFSRIPHIGTGDLIHPTAPSLVNNELIARWSWGQRQRAEFTQPYLLEADLKNDDDTLNPIVGGNLEHTTTIDGTVELSEFGFNSINRNSNLNVSGFADFQYPAVASAAYMGCWIKSHLVDYSSGFAIIAASHTLASDETVYWGIGIDVDNQIKGFTYGTGGIDWVTPVGGNVTIDAAWHYVFFAVGLKNADDRCQLFIVDNDWGQPVVGIHAQGTKNNAAVRFGIGSSPIDTSYGFAGIIDELVVSKWTGGIRNRRIIADPEGEIGQSTIAPTDLMGNYTEGYRFDSNVFVSPVNDTMRENSLFTGVYTEYDNTNGSSVQFSFRASDTIFDQGATYPEWTGFTAPNKVLHATAIGHEDLGIWLRGRYQQVRMKLNPSSADSPLQLDTPVVNVVEISTGVDTKVLGATTHAYEPGVILGQVVIYDAAKTIDKVSINLTVNSEDRQTFVVGQDGHLAFQAANWQESREDWAFQPIPNWVALDDAGYEDAYGLSWETSGTTIRNTRQLEIWPTEDEAITNAPYLKYRIFFPSGGIYQLWGYGYVDGDGIFWTFDDDETNLRRMTLGADSIPMWTRFGSFFLEEGGLHTFTVYLAGNNTAILDQWLFTQNSNMDAELANDRYLLPQPNSTAPFNTAVRLRSLYLGALDDLVNPVASPANNVTMWLPSGIVAASGEFNYGVVNDSGTTGVVFTDGVSIEFWQIGGTSKHFAAWDYTKAD